MCATGIGQTGIGPTSLDLLTLDGVLPYDASMYVKGTPSPYLESLKGRPPYSPYAPGVPQLNAPVRRDTYVPKKKMSLTSTLLAIKEKYKDIAFGTLALYIAGVVASKGSKNPIEGAKGLGRGLKKVLNGFCWLVKQMWS